MRYTQQITKSKAIARGWGGATALLLAGVVLSGCHIDMWNQSKMKPYYESDFFPDRSANRPLVEHTVPRGQIHSADPAYYTGFMNGKLVATIPVRAVQSFESPKAMLLRGQNRFNAYCSPCHGRAGDGNGFIMQRGLGYWQKLAASYHTDRLRKIQDGHFYDVITNGYGVMYSYGARIQDVNDRWAVVSYVRALQLTRATSPAMPETNTPLQNSLGMEKPLNQTPGGVATDQGSPPDMTTPGGAPSAPSASDMSAPGAAGTDTGAPTGLSSAATAPGATK